MWSFHRGSCLCSGAPKSKPAGVFSRSRIMDVLRAELCCFTRKSRQRGVLWFPCACALFQQPSNDFQADNILPLPPKLINFSKEPLLLRSTNITKPHPYKLLNGTGIGDVGYQIKQLSEISSVVLHGWTRSQRKPNDINYVPPRENDTVEYHGAIGIFLLTMQHDLKDNVAIIPCSTTANVISSYRLFPLHY